MTSSETRAARRPPPQIGGVDCPPSVAAVLGDNLDDRSSTKALQRLGRGISVTLLRGVERLADVSPGRFWKAAHISSA